MQGNVIQINISPGGVPKTPIAEARVEALGILGDDHFDKRHHGGLRKAILLLAAEVVDELCAEGWPLFYGALGENLTTRGMNHADWRTGQRYRVGSVVLELTTPRQPCDNLTPYGRGIQHRIYDWQVKALDPASPKWGLSGFYASVLQPGTIQQNDNITPLEEVIQAAL